MNGGILAWLLTAGWATATPLFQPEPSSSKRYFESNTVMAYFPDGTYVQGLVAISNIGLGNGHGACRLLIVRPNEAAINLMDTVDADGWQYTATPQPSLRVGSCRIGTSGAGTQLDITLQDHTALISLDVPAKSRALPGVPLHQGDTFYEQDVLVPFAKAEVVIAQGEASQTLQGYGFADHSRSNAVPADLGRGALRFRGFKPGCSTLIHLRFPDAGPHAPGYLWREGTAGPQDMQAWTSELPPGGEDPRPVLARLSQGKRTLTIQATRRLVRSAPLEDYGLLGHVLGKVLGKVVNETYEAVLNEESTPCTGVHGVLELDHNSN